MAEGSPASRTSVEEPTEPPASADDATVHGTVSFTGHTRSNQHILPCEIFHDFGHEVWVLPDGNRRS